jgi:hypothetical protein
MTLPRDLEYEEFHDMGRHHGCVIEASSITSRDPVGRDLRREAPFFLGPRVRQLSGLLRGASEGGRALYLDRKLQGAVLGDADFRASSTEAAISMVSSYIGRHAGSESYPLRVWSVPDVRADVDVLELLASYRRELTMESSAAITAIGGVGIQMWHAHVDFHYARTDRKLVRGWVEGAFGE